MRGFGIIQLISFVLYMAFQIIFLKNIVLFHAAFCFIYIGFLLMLPVETGRLLLMIIGFSMGIIVDTFYDSLGLHAFASVFIMFIRNPWLGWLTPQGGYDAGSVPTMESNGIQWFLTYSIPLILIHQSLLFFIEVGGFQYTGFTILKIVSSTLFTGLIIVMLQFLFPGRKRI
jgi:hypothetical protein